MYNCMSTQLSEIIYYLLSNVHPVIYVYTYIYTHTHTHTRILIFVILHEGIMNCGSVLPA